MNIGPGSRWYLWRLDETHCRACNDKPVYVCMRCQRPYCVTHLRLVDWRVYEVAMADNDAAPTVRATAEAGQCVRHLVCVDCAGDLANFG